MGASTLPNSCTADGGVTYTDTELGKMVWISFINWQWHHSKRTTRGMQCKDWVDLLWWKKADQKSCKSSRWILVFAPT